MPSVNCAECGHANRGDARFCEACGSSLTPRCPSCGAEVSATARFCSSCGSPVAPEAPSTGALKVVSVVFSDLVGSTELQEKLEPESVRRVMARFYEAMRGVVERHGGAIQKFIGDAVVAVFGVPSVREDDAVRAVRCAASMGTALEQLNDELEQTWGVRLQIRTGVNTGELAISDEGIFVGDTMNTAARLEQAAGTGQVLLGEATWRLVRHELEVEEVAPLEAKGKSTPLRAWRIVSTQPRSASAAEAPLVGRADELERLRAGLEQAVAAQACRLVTLIGSPGLGKSRLAAEFARSLKGQATVLEGHCEQSGEGITFLPVADVLRAAASIADEDPPERVVEKLTQIVPEGDDRQRVVARVAGLLGAGPPAAPEETFWGVRTVLESLARERPLVVVLDDVHWGQPMFLDLIEHLVEWARDAAILLVAIARPELRETRGALTASGRRAADVIELDPLGPDQSRELVGGLLGQVELPDELLARILETTEGNPLFLGELLRMLVEEGSLERAGDVWVAAGGAEAVQVPPTIQALLTARIERLRADERSVVERASVIGKQFYRGAVAELVAPPIRSGIDGHLETLRRKDMVEPEGTYWIDEPVYRFHHVLIRDAAYHLLLKEARAELHEKFADWLQTKAGELVGEHEEVIAYHLEQAHEYRRQLGPLDERGKALGVRAAAMLASAGRRALAREDLAAAANLMQRALGREAGVGEDQMLWDLGEALISAGDTARVGPVVERLSGPRGDVLAAQLAVLTGTGSLEETLERVTGATSALASAGDDAAEAKGHHVTAQVQAQLGRVADVETSLDHALLAARKADDRRRITAVLAAAPRAALWGPSPVVRASGRCLDVVRILRMTPGNRHVEAVALRCQAVLEAMRGRADAAREILAGGRTTLEELGLTLELHELAMHAGIVELLAGRPDSAEGLLRSARDGFASLGLSVSAAQAAALLARALAEEGRDDDALAETEYAEQHAGGDLKTTITWLGVRAEALARRGPTDEALQLAARAVALAEPTDALADKADANMALARVLRQAGQAGEARRAAGAALALYGAKDHAVGVRWAGELTAQPSVDAASSAQASAARIEDPELAALVGRYVKCWEDRDAQGIASLYAEDYVTIDHRELGWEERTGREANLEWFRSSLSLSHDFSVHLDRVIASAPGIIAFTLRFRGPSAETGGEAEIAMGRVVAFRDGLITRAEIFEPDAEISMRACFEDLRGRMLLGNRPPERCYERFVDCFGRHDRDGLADIWCPEIAFVDHRQIAWEELHGVDSLLKLADSAHRMADDIRCVVDEVIAADERAIAIRSRYVGSASDGGGVIEIPAGTVNLTERGQVIRSEWFDHDDREGMLARYRELGGTTDVLGDRPPERLWAEQKKHFDAHDLDRLLELYAEEWTFTDHRQLGYERFGRSGAAEMFQSAFEASPDVRIDADRVIACDDRVIALQGAYRGTSPAAAGGEGEIAFSVVTVIDDGLIRSTDVFAPHDEIATLARWRELHGLGLLSDTPPERELARFIELWGLRDLDALKAHWPEDVVLVDHRALAWEEVNGREQLLELSESAWNVSPDIRLCVEEVLACDERVLAVRCVYVGTGTEGGGLIELPIAFVNVVEDGRLLRTEVFDPDHREALLARYRELGGTAGVLGGRPPERLFAEFKRRFNAHDLAGLVELYHEDFTLTDHRRIGSEVVHGPTASLESVFAGSRDVRVDIDEVIACDDRVIALQEVYHGTAHEAAGGEFELRFALVSVVENGRALSTELFDPHDREALLVRYRELGGQMPATTAQRSSERVLAELRQAQNARDYDRIGELVTDDWYMVDHRALGWPEAHGRERCIADLRSVYDASPDVRLEYEEVLAADDNVVVTLNAWRGRGLKAGEHETRAGAVHVINDGRWVGVDFYDPDDRQTMIARYVELGGGLSKLGERRSERVCAEWLRRYAARDLDGILALNAPDFVVVDHRQVGWVQMDNDRYAAEIQSGWRSAADIRMEIEEVLAANERSLAVILTFRGTALGDVGGGRFELPLGLISLLDGERGARAEWFDPSDRDAMLARFTELAGQDDVLGDSPPERVWARYIDSFNSSDFGALERILAPDYAFEDRRTLGYEPAEGIDGGVGMLRSARKASADLRIEADVVLACDERVIALLVAWRGRGVKAGELEIPMGVVAVVEDDRLKLHELFNPDDRAAIMARFAELGGKQSGRQERQSERLMEEVRRALNAREYERLAELVAEDWYFVDHRALGWEEGHGRDKCEAIMRSFFDASPDVRFDFGDLLAADDRVMVVHAAIRGHGRKAGEHETVTGAVYLIEGGLWAGVDFYEPDDRWAMTARYAELGGGLEPLGDRPPERLYAEFLRRWAAGDTGKIVELCADGYRHNDHRKLGWEAVDSLAALWDFVASAVAGTSGFHFDVDEVLACDDRVLALRGTWHAHSPETGSEMEFKLGHVAVVEHGLLVRQDHYDYDDTRAMLARFAELGGTQPALGNRPSERVMAEVERLLNARDYERFAELVPDDWYWIDHRALGWEEAHGREECLRHMRSTFDASPDVRLEYGDVLACDDNVIAMHTAWRGRGLKAGELEVEVGAVFLVEDGLWAGVDFYEPDDHHAMIVRYAELGGGAALLGDRPPERFFRRWIPIAAAGDVDGVAELVAEDFVRIDHRALGWEPLEGRQANVGLWRSAYESAAHIRMEVDEVLACDARVIALRFTWHGLAGGTIGGGDFAVGVGQVNVIEDGIWRSCDQYDTNDREAMLVRYRELTGAADLRGERAPERFYAEYARLWAAADRDRLLELIDEKWVLTDRRALALWEEMRGSEGARKILESSFRGVREPQFTLQEVLACDESVIAARVAWSGFGQGDAQFSNEMGLVSVVRDGRELTLDVYDADDRQGMVARYVELGGGLGMLGETRIERAFKEYAKRYAAHDLDGMLALMTDDFVHVDRRKMAWEELDKERFAAEVQSVWAGTSDVRLDVNEVIALSESLLLVISTYRGAAASEVGAGEFEYPVGFLVVSAGDRYSRFEWFEPDDREAMLARYRELSETWPSVGDRPSERVIAAMYQGLNARDYERLAALVLDDCYVFDHRALGWEEAHGRDQILAIMRSWLDASPKLGVDYQVLACDDEVLVAHMAIHGQGVKAGELEITLGAVHLVKDGRWGGIDFYDPHDRQAMIARYVELGGGLGKLGDTASERLFAEYARRYAARDYDGVLAMMSEDYVQVDHRSLGWAQIGKEQNAAEIRSVWAGTTDVRPEVEEVLAADDHALACICTYRGSADASAGGGQFEYPVGFLLVTDGERSTRVEWFDADDREAMLARYRELCTAVPEAVRLGMEILASWNAHDIDRAMELYAEDIEFIDHRALGAEPLRGQAAVRELHRAAFEVFPDNVQQLDEVIAADERVIAFRVTIRGRSPDAAGGEGEIPLGGVDVFEDGKLTSVDLFEPDDIAAIVRRYVELGGGQGPLGDRPPERFFAEFCRRWASGDVERILELYSSDYRNVDHRQVGWEEIDGPKALRDFVESALGAVTDLRCEVDEVLACDARAIALCTTWRGHSAETGGEFEFKFGYAAVVENGLLVRQDHFDHGDTRRMLARYEELSKGPAARTILRRAELCNARKLDELRSLYAEDFELIDHRPMPWDGARGGEEMTSLIEGAFELSPDAEVTVDILDDDGGEVVAWRQTWSGTFGAGGRAESVIDTVTVVRDHRFVRSELFEPDQEDEMRRRLAELRGSSGVADEVVVRDRRGLPKRDLAGIEAYRELIGADGPGELVRTDGELRLFRQRDDPALLVISRWREGAIVEAIVTRAPQFADAWMAALSLQSPGEVIDAFPGAFVLALDDGFAAVRASDRHQERFSARDAAVERAEELAQLRGWMDMARNFVRAINARDWDAFLSMYATDYVLVDHRLMGWGELEGPAKMVEVLKGTIELAPSASIDLIEFLDFDLNAGLGAVRQTYTGEWDGGAYEIAWDSIMVVDDGRFTRGEVFGVDQVDAMRARMAELLAGD